MQDVVDLQNDKITKLEQKVFEDLTTSTVPSERILKHLNTEKSPKTHIKVFCDSNIKSRNDCNMVVKNRPNQSVSSRKKWFDTRSMS
jgi:hypothetical protein